MREARLRATEALMSYPRLEAWQYRVSQRAGHGIALDDKWYLEVGPDLPVTALHGPQSQTVGWVVGFAIDMVAQAVLDHEEGLHLQEADLVSAALERLAGRFIVIWKTDAGLRIYTDASAQVPCVYDPDLQIIGSTAHALFSEEEYQARFDKTGFDKLRVNGEGWFPSGLTAHRGVHRVLTNHYLDLATFTVHRHTVEQASTAEMSPTEMVGEIISIVQKQFAALQKSSKKIALALTAGLDSRCILACVKPLAHQIDLVTVVGSDRHAVDTIVAKKIAKQFNLNHTTYPRITATSEQREMFIRRGGHCNGDSNSWYHPTVQQLAPTHVFVGGAGAEAARAFYWRPNDTPDTSLADEKILGRMGLPPHPPVLEALRTHRAGMPSVDTLDQLDRLYAEDRNCSWYAVQFCSDPTLVRYAPLLTYRTLELMRHLPTEWKRQSRLGHEIIKHAWPELGEIEYNSLGFVRNTLVKLQRVMMDPNLVLKKLRRLRN